jgi:hypothetical protein
MGAHCQRSTLCHEVNGATADVPGFLKRAGVSCVLKSSKLSLCSRSHHVTELLRLSHIRLHLALRKLRLQPQNFLKILGMASELAIEKPASAFCSAKRTARSCTVLKPAVISLGGGAPHHMPMACTIASMGCLYGIFLGATPSSAVSSRGLLVAGAAARH